MGLLRALRLASISERFNSTGKLKKKKRKKSSLKTVNHHRDGIYTSFRLALAAFTEVIDFLFLTDSEGPGSNPLKANFS